LILDAAHTALQTGSEPSSDPSDPSASFGNAVLKIAWRVVGFLAGLLILFLLIGWALPGTWQATRTRTFSVPADSVFSWVSDLDYWPRWMAWEGVAMEPVPGSGGLRKQWDDPALGSGTLEILSATPDTEVRYQVQVQGGLRTLGTFHLRPDGPGSRLDWIEEGDFGRNPLLAYFALAMHRLQGNEMDKSLDRLDEALSGTPDP